MMSALSGMFGMATGAFSLRWLVYPVMALLAMVGAHVSWESYKGRLREQGVAQCTADYEAKIREEEANKANETIGTLRGILDGERETMGRLRDEFKRISTERDELFLQTSPDTDSKCLSDGLLKRMDGRRDAEPRYLGNGAQQGGAAASSTGAESLPKRNPRRAKQKGEGQ
jgi:hypothetical protein